jgi:hypothetical protein
MGGASVGNIMREKWADSVDSVGERGPNPKKRVAGKRAWKASRENTRLVEGIGVGGFRDGN